MRKKHTNECPISNYFTFPSTGHAVGLRPGDILIFNPLYTHCISSKTDEYNGIDVANISLYTKMQNIDKHDNDIEFNDKEERIYTKMTKEEKKIEKKTVDLTEEKVGKEKKKTKIEEMRNVVQNDWKKTHDLTEEKLGKKMKNTKIENMLIVVQNEMKKKDTYVYM